MALVNKRLLIYRIDYCCLFDGVRSYNIRFRDTKIIIHGTNIKHNKNVNEMAGFRFIDQYMILMMI